MRMDGTQNSLGDTFMADEDPTRDRQTVTPDGKRIQELIEGVQIRPAITHPDERGELTEIHNPAWGFDAAPLAYVYQFTIRPDIAKGWVMHAIQHDRMFVSLGAVKMVLYDARPTSPTYEMVNEIFVTERNRALVTWPHHVYHALHNIGRTDAVLINMPTRPYDHAEPDKYRLPLNNEIIPYQFDPAVNGW